ncbi:hypothetical protein NL676_009714 [Syzygium grande]|nr:hypothetical protein NL676_009714 [Syzygium grande]
MADSLITFFLNKSYDLLQEERKISASAQKQLESLINEAKHMSIFLRKADSMDIIDEAHRECLKQVREILFDTEDSIEKYMLREGLLLRRPSLKKMLVPFKSLRNKHRIYANAEDLKSKAADAMDNLQKYTVDFRQGSSSKTQNDTRGGFRNDTLLLTDAQLVGIEGPREHLVQWPLKDDIFMVAAIHGMAGIGKTTLANSVYCDGRVKQRFTCRLWATVSESFNIKELLKRIVKRLCKRLKLEFPGNMDDMDDLALRSKIKRLLKKRPYVLVLNDVWSEDLLHSIKNLFVGTSGRLIITTRDEAIANAFAKNLEGHIYKMDLLSQEDSFKLFCRKTFRQDSCPPGFAQVSKKILKKCGRLSGLFITKPLDLTEWKEEYFHFKYGFEAPPRIGDLKLLKKLCVIDLSQAKPSLLTELGRLNELRRLGITNLRKKDGTVLCSSIEKLKNLNALSITSASEAEFLHLPFSSEPPPKSLQRLYLAGRLEKLPEWIGSLSNLVKVYLKGSRLSDDPLDSLKDLEKLEHLELQQYGGQNLKFQSGGFRKLRLLGLDDSHQLTQVEIEGGALLALEKLTIQRCRSLKTLPEAIVHIKSLRILKLFSMHQELIKAVHKNGPDYWKIDHIPEVYFANWITEEKQWEYVSAHTGAAKKLERTLNFFSSV